MKKVLFAMAMVLSMSAFAALDANAVYQAGFNNLTEAQKAEVVKMVATQATAPADTLDKIDRYAQLGANLGKGLAATAKELGVAVNDFAQTRIGMIATVLLVWHIIGGAILHVFGGLVIWILGFSAVTYIFRKSSEVVITYDETKTNIFGNHPVLKVDRSEIGSGYFASCLVGYGITLLAGMLVLFG